MNLETTDPEKLEQGDKIIIAITVPEGYENVHPDFLFGDLSQDLHYWTVEYAGIERKPPMPSSGITAESATLNHQPNNNMPNDIENATGSDCPSSTCSGDARDFIAELRELLNRRSMENASDTPDFILAQYLTDCLLAWNRATKRRVDWYERTPQEVSFPNKSNAMRKHKIYYIEAYSGWFLAKCWTLRQARSQASIEYGRTVKNVRLATDDEIKHFLALKGENALG